VGRGEENCEVDGESGVSGLAGLRCGYAVGGPGAEALLALPTLGIAAVLYVGGKDVISGALTIGELSLFITLLLQLVWPLEALGWIINLGQRATAAASRSFARRGRRSCTR